MSGRICQVNSLRNLFFSPLSLTRFALTPVEGVLVSTTLYEGWYSRHESSRDEEVECDVDEVSDRLGVACMDQVKNEGVH